VSALGQFGKAAVPSLMEALRDTDGNVLILAATALGKIGPDAKAAVPALVPLLKDDEEEIRKAATAALQKIDPAALKP